MIRTNSSSQTNKQIPEQNEFKLPNSNKVHSLMKILIGDKTILKTKGYIFFTFSNSPTIETAELIVVSSAY
jgi:hypothetical protein